VLAAEAGLVEFSARVRFRHPLVRSTAYRLLASGEPARKRAARPAAAASQELTVQKAQVAQLARDGCPTPGSGL
jgi:hypothetical protein